MSAALAIAKNTFREAVRDRVLYAIAGFGACFVLLDLFFGALALHDPVAVRSVGLAGVYVFGMIVTIFLGSSLLYREIERRTLYFVLAKPVSRAEVVFGKFAGLIAAVALTTLLMGLVYLAVAGYETRAFDAPGSVAILFQIMEETLFVALLMFFSSVAAPLTATLAGFMLLLAGHLTAPAFRAAVGLGSAAHIFIGFLYYVLPNLEKFDIRAAAVHGVSIPWAIFFLALAYTALYAGLLLYAAMLLFRRREL